MGQYSRHTLFTRLGQALTASGASKAVSRLKLLQQFVDVYEDNAIDSLIMRHCREYGIAPDWVFKGVGCPETAVAASASTPVFAMSSVHPKTGRWRLVEIERITLAPHILSPTRFVTRMECRSLEPRIREGAYLVVDTEQDQLPETADNFAPFAVDVAGEGLIVRMACYERRSDRVRLTSLTPGLPPMLMRHNASEHRVVGRVVWVAQTL